MKKWKSILIDVKFNLNLFQNDLKVLGQIEIGQDFTVDQT